MQLLAVLQVLTVLWVFSLATVGYGVAEGRAAPSGCRPHAPRVEAVIGFVVRWVFDERGALSSPDGHSISVSAYLEDSSAWEI